MYENLGSWIKTGATMKYEQENADFSGIPLKVYMGKRNVLEWADFKHFSSLFRSMSKIKTCFDDYFDCKNVSSGYAKGFYEPEHYYDYVVSKLLQPSTLLSQMETTLQSRD